MTRPRRKATAADGFDWKKLRNMNARMIHASQQVSTSACQLVVARSRMRDSRHLDTSANRYRAVLERVMNSIRNALGMRETEIAREPRRPWNPHFYAVFAQVHNTL